jgi:hypothetical protein
MFRSKVRALIIPQYEHGRLAGTLASLWGNEDFARPAIDFTSFIKGVTLHDWHYGVVDDLAIGGVSEVEWLDMVRKGIEYWFDDPITDIVAKLHLRRLVSGRNLPEADTLLNLVELRIIERLPSTSFSREQFEWADTITRYCDNLAFDFSFEKPVEKSSAVYARANSRKETPITYAIKPGGEIVVEPWPFSVEAFSGIIIGYHQAGYPETLTPEIVPFRVYNHA